MSSRHEKEPHAAKVTMGSSRVIVPFGHLLDRSIADLCEEIGERVKRFSGSSEALRIRTLSTSDGFVYMPEDIVGQVLHHAEHLIAQDFRAWMEEHLPKCTHYKTAWCTIEREDFEDDITKRIVVGKHEQLDSIYVRFVESQKNVHLELLDAEACAHYPKTGIHLIARRGNMQWSAEVYLEVEKIDHPARILMVKVKSKSDDRAVVKKVHFVHGEDGFKLDRVETVTHADRSLHEFEDTHKAVRKVVCDKGGSLTPEPEDVEMSEAEVKAELEKVKSSGESDVVLTQTNKTEIDMSWPDNNKFEQYLMSNFRCNVGGSAKTPLSIVNADAEYCVEGSDSWHAAKRVRCGDRNGFYNYRWDGDCARNVALGVSYLALNVVIGVDGSPWDRVRRMHKSLLHGKKSVRVRVTLTDSVDKTCVIEFDVKQPPLKLVENANLDKFLGDCELVARFTCDDVQEEARAYFQLGKSADNERLEVLFGATGASRRSHYLYLSNFRHIAYNAKKSGDDAVTIEHVSFSHKGATGRLIALCDTKQGYVYALRAELKTSTSERVEVIPMVDLKEKE